MKFGILFTWKNFFGSYEDPLREAETADSAEIVLITSFPRIRDWMTFNSHAVPCNRIAWRSLWPFEFARRKATGLDSNRLITN